ncbi:hypothetical protein K523DRAFT_332104 [Schizophyllum commune Tattone D]|nr:hypothetical protein K523DRAFT_332104 [Schizophyllum commune Tattone D]
MALTVEFNYSIEELEDRTRRLQEALLRARNFQSPANKLPAEVLAIIFDLVRIHHDDFLPQWPDWTSLDWLVVTHVCSRWRAVALNLPYLWSTIDLCHEFSADAGRTFLARSCGRPLQVFFSSRELGHSEQDIRVLQDILHDHVECLEQLHVAVESSHALCLVFSNLHSVAPKLESLSICLRSGDSDRHSMTRLRSALQDKFSAVRKLVTVRCPIWDSIAFSHLTHQAIYQTSNYNRGIQALLQQCPDLEELVLTDIWIFGRATDEIIRLPRLQYLQVITLGSFDDGVRTSPLVAGLDLPASCRYRVANPAMAEVLAVLTTSDSPLSKQRIHTANIMFYGHRRMSIRSGTVSVGCAPSDHDISLVSRAVDPDTKLTVVLGENAPNEELCVQLLSHMRRMRTLVIIDEPPASGVNSAIAEPLVNALGLRPNVEAADSDTVVLPALETLHVHSFKTAIWPCLWSAVSRRAQSGAPLKELRVYEYPLSDGTPGAVRNISFDASGLVVGVTNEASDLTAGAAQDEVWEPAERPVNGVKWASSGMEEVPEDENEDHDNDDSESDWDSDY